MSARAKLCIRLSAPLKRLAVVNTASGAVGIGASKSATRCMRAARASACAARNGSWSSRTRPTSPERGSSCRWHHRPAPLPPSVGSGACVCVAPSICFVNVDLPCECSLVRRKSVGLGQPRTSLTYSRTTTKPSCSTRTTSSACIWPSALRRAVANDNTSPARMGSCAAVNRNAEWGPIVPKLSRRPGTNVEFARVSARCAC